METISLIESPISSEDQRSSGGLKRSNEEDLDKYSEITKRAKMHDLDSGLQGLSKCSKLTEANSQGHHTKEDEPCEVAESTASLLKDKSFQLKLGHIPEPDDICLSLSLGESTVQSPAHNVQSKENDKTNQHFSGTNNGNDQQCSIGLSLDVNEAIFHPYKKLGHMISINDSECGSTTGPLEETDSLRLWKEMKHNNFLSNSHGHGGIPLPKQRGRPPKKKRYEELKKKNEHANKHTKSAAPTSLLSGLNPGIIKHVRNSKQVNSIIEHMLSEEREEGQMQTRSKKQCESGKLGISANNGPSLPRALHSSKSGENSTSSGCNSEYDDESLELKLSSGYVASENACSASSEDFPISRDTLTCLSLTGASVASLWLDLLQQDIKGRLAALRRSKKRVRHVLQTELPYLLSKEISSTKENPTHPSETEVMNMHTARWKSIFSQMDKTLIQEGKHLEKWLKQVQDMEAHCDEGLKYFSANGSSQVGPSEETSGDNKKYAEEKEKAVRAAAAAIYSTSNFITTKENTLPC